MTVRSSVVALVACSLVAAACSSDPKPQPSPTPTPTTASGRFLALAHTAKYQEQGALSKYSDDVLLPAAKRACSDFHGLHTQNDRSLAASDLIRVGWDATQAAALVDAAHQKLCP